MPRELLIAAGPGEWRAALVEDGIAVELHVERGDTRVAGSIHLGRIVQAVAGLDAVLVDIGEDRPGFLPVRDVPPGIDAGEGAAIVVQVRREAWQDKAARLTARFAGMPPPRKEDVGPPAQFYPDAGFASALRLRLADAPDRVLCDETAAVPELRTAFAESEVGRGDPADWPIDLDAAFDVALRPTLALPGGGSIHIETVHAATMIDVDTGSPRGGSASRSASTANFAAAGAIARELRLRAIGGPVVIDFVGVEGRALRERLRHALAAALAGDPARPELLGWTRLGHIELVRPRRGRSLADAMLEPRDDRQLRKLPVATAYEALRRVQREARARPAAQWRLAVPPPIEAALRGPAKSALRDLETRLGRPIALLVDPTFAADGFDIAPV